MADVPSSAQDLALEVLRHGPLPRSRLARRLKLSPGSLSRLSRPLVDQGLLLEGEAARDPATGRPTRPLDIALDRFRFVGVNITGTTAWAVATDVRCTVLERTHRALDSSSPQAVVDVVARLVEDLCADGSGGCAAVGLALGGHVDAHGRVTAAPFLGWRSPVDLTRLASGALGRPVVVGNDVAALTRAEHLLGAARGVHGLAVITIGAGVGYGLVLGDRVIETPDTGLQPLGHFPLDRSGRQCPAGHRGCASALLTTSALSAAGALALGRPTSADEVFDLAETGAVAARRVVEDAAANLGHLIAAVANLTTVQRVLVTGEGVRLAQVANDALRQALRADRDPAAGPVDVIVRPHDFHAWAQGAAGMAVRHFVSTPAWTAAEHASPGPLPPSR